MAVYEFIINNVQKVTINMHDRTVTVYYNAYDISQVGGFPANDWPYVQEVIHAHSIRGIDGQGGHFSHYHGRQPFYVKPVHKENHYNSIWTHTRRNSPAMDLWQMLSNDWVSF